ncbi:nuclear transport factor 2 family protein [Teichococcus oryzae]|uniref:Nuclear transport factor 2 family protein n=1 Tax=Teichococcus oryzae TaxID=1608942 RepID=A0A5B2T957_9PROT|nr:nuclear transport factor 2 family protein [Pseudoroseomonas oryzae]KAA2211206.1 nuclear transport factor 2 family protein [Pseudoroseomonas oryzae]
MSLNTEQAKAFFAACDTGQGWDACRSYCAPGATFSAQTDVLTGITTLQQYTEWMRDLLKVLTDGNYEVKSFATDEERNNVCVYATFSGTHLEGGPVSPTGRATKTDYVYIMQFSNGKVTHLTKIWNSGHALKELGWA